MNQPKIIAFHLPQFFPTPENDAWWEPGFTEWTNVAKARPLFPGHLQPNLPGESSFYDLRLYEARKKQAELALDAGVYGFCYWHYWFGRGRRLLSEPVDRMLVDGQPDLPFMLGWANQTWTGIWHGAGNRVLIQQEYPGSHDVAAHCEVLEQHFRHPLYIRVDDRPLLHIYDPSSPGFTSDLLNLYRTELRRRGYQPWFLLKRFRREDTPFPAADVVYITDLMPAMEQAGLRRSMPSLASRVTRQVNRILGRAHQANQGPKIIDYQKATKATVPTEYAADDIPFIFPNWDNTPRSGMNGRVFVDTSPDSFGQHARTVLSGRRSGAFADIYFLKSWNEWAEGNYLEPDRRYGRGWIQAMRAAVDEARTSNRTSDGSATPVGQVVAERRGLPS